MGYRVTAGYVTVEMGVPDVPGARARRDVRRGLPLPDDVPAAEVRMLLERGDIEPVEAEPPHAPPSGPPVPEGTSNPNEPPAGTVAEVLAWVDGSPDRAGVALAAEQDKGDKARSTLVDALTAIVEPQQ